MRRTILPCAAAALAAFLAATPVTAQSTPISGAFTGTLTQAPGGRCGPGRITVDVLFGGFLSPFGTGTGTQAACVDQQTFAIIDGSFSFTLGGIETPSLLATDSFFGRLSGQLTPLGGGLFQGMSMFTITGGTGRFANATGGGTTQGTQNTNTGTVAFQLTGTVNGVVQTVPEPSTLLLVAGGLAAAAAIGRGRRKDAQE